MTALHRQLHRHLKFIGLLGLFIVGVLVHQWALPVMEGNDETIHYNYVLWLRVTNRLPDRASYETNSTKQASGQAPLTYWVAANVLNVLNVPHQITDLWPGLADIRNRWFTPPDWSNRADNFNQYYHGDDERGFGHPEVVLADRILRLLSLGYGVLAVIGAYGIARELFASETWALTATAIFAFTPQMLYMCAMLSNDISATAFATLAIWQTVILLRRRLSPPRVGAVAVLLALAGLSKISAMVITPGVLLAIAFSGRRTELPTRRILLNLALAGVIIAALLGPWIWFGWSTFRDPFGLKTHEDVSRAGLPPPTPLQVVTELPSTVMSYWAKFGSASIWLTPVSYVLFSVIALLSVWGYVRYFRHTRMDWDSFPVQTGIVAAVMIGPALVTLLYWLITLFPVAFAITGRLIYFIHGLFAAGLTGGLYLLCRGLCRPWANAARLFSAGTLMATGLVIAPMVVRTAFAEPLKLTSDQLPPLQGQPVEFDHTIRFLGYTAPGLAIHQGSIYTVTLCWEVLKPTGRDGAFSIKMFDQNAQAVADRTSIPGMGHFSTNLWRAGDIFCDRVEVPVAGALKPGHLYNVILAMFDQLTSTPWPATDASGNAVQYPLIYQAVSPAGDMTASAQGIAWQPTAIQFPDLANVKGYAVEGTPVRGGTIKLNLLWEVTRSTPYDWSEFIHLVGTTTSVSLGDGTPVNHWYPTWAWSPGERIVDSWTLTIPSDLPAGEYSLQIGFTERSAGQRIAVSLNGNPIPDRSAEVVKVTIH